MTGQLTAWRGASDTSAPESSIPVINYKESLATTDVPARDESNDGDAVAGSDGSRRAYDKFVLVHCRRRIHHDAAGENWCATGEVPPPIFLGANTGNLC